MAVAVSGTLFTGQPLGNVFAVADIRNNMFASVMSSGGTNIGEVIGHLRRSEEELGSEAVFRMDDE